MVLCGKHAMVTFVESSYVRPTCFSNDLNVIWINNLSKFQLMYATVCTRSYVPLQPLLPSECVLRQTDLRLFVERFLTFLTFDIEGAKTQVRLKIWRRLFIQLLRSFNLKFSHWKCVFLCVMGTFSFFF